MISYGNPVCPVTNHRANLFCATEGCTKPAFACGEPCLHEEGHFDNGPTHQIMEWGTIEESVRLAMELPLSKEELHNLERQEKQIKIVAEEIKAIQQNHEVAIRKCKGRLNLKGVAEKVLTAVKNKATQAITGGEMAGYRNKLIDELLKKLHALISEHSSNMEHLIKPEKIAK
jgi:predicted DNA binding CopG/RHH family protein